MRYPYVDMIKMHSVENVILVVPPCQDFLWTPARVRQVCDFRLGIGADQIMVCSDTAPMSIWNHDGSRALACGNGTRCVIGWMNPPLGEKQSIQGPLGPLTGWKTAQNTVAICQGAVRLGGFWLDNQWIESTLSPVVCSNGVKVLGVPVDVGNPHVVVMAHPPAELDLLWKPTSHHFPDGVNVSFVWPYSSQPNSIDETRFSVQTWERGVGLTQGCGSAACAIGAVLSHSLGGGPARGKVNEQYDDNSPIVPGTKTSPYRLIMPGGCIQVWQEGSLWVHCADYQTIANITAECFWQDAG